MALENRKIPYLFKLRLTKNVKRYLQQIFWSDGWEDAGQGWEGYEGSIQLSGWQGTRRIVALRRLLVGDVLLSAEQQQLASTGSHRVQTQTDPGCGRAIAGFRIMFAL